MTDNTKRNSDADTKKTAQAANRMWGGRFSSEPAKIMADINASIEVDIRLYKQDIRASLAHAAMLADSGIISRSDYQAIAEALPLIEREIEDAKMALDPKLEDIHMHIEARLRELVGDAAGRLHTARSRNDQVATDFRLWVRDHIDILDTLLQDLQRHLLDRAEEEAATPMPGYTHLQAAQPISFGHHMMAYVEMFARDRSRFTDARQRANESPLGAAALAGTTYPIDREATARALGFTRPMANSMDAVSDRDFALEFLSASTLLSLHLSRLAEELILWNSHAFQFISLPDNLTTGSSIMPQKKNPDAAELIRAKAGQSLGAFVQLCTVLKALPMTYAKDMQEDKAPVFGVYDSLSLCVQAMTAMIATLSVKRSALREATKSGYLTATDLADWLVQVHKIPFREAHHITGRVVKLAEEKGCEIDALALSDLQKIDSRISEQALEIMQLEQSLARRNSFGGTAPDMVKKAVNAARKHYL